MLFEIVTLFPESFKSFFEIGLIGKAVHNKIITYHFHNPRVNGLGNYRQVDDYPFGGGPGMLLRADVMQKTLAKVKSDVVILMSPRGKVLDQQLVDDLMDKKSLAILCGQYEGLDHRFVDQYVDLEISLGDYVLNSGETAAKVLIETVSRREPGFMKKIESLEDSFSDGLIERDQFTRPLDWSVGEKKKKFFSSAVCKATSDSVPPVLTGGDLKKIEEWGKQNALFRTWERRPDLLNDYDLNEDDVQILYEELIKRFSSKNFVGEKQENINECTFKKN